MYAPTSVGALLEVGLSTHPHREALVDSRHRLSYQATDQLVRSLVGGLRHLGLGSGDRVAVSLPNSVHIVALYLACMRMGAVFVGVHPGLAPVEKARMIELTHPAVVAATPDIIEELGRLTPRVTGRHVAVDLADRSMAVLSGPCSDDRNWSPDPSLPAAIAMTSGTTGVPKGVVHDQQHMLLPPSVILHHRMGGRGERVGVHLPLTTLNVLILGPVLALLGGGTCICLDGHAPEVLASWVAAERIEHMSTSPAVVHDLLAHRNVDPRGLAGVRLGVGGIACPDGLRRRYLEAVGRPFTTGYGLTEAPTSVAQETERIPHRPGASGVAMAHVRIEIVDEDGRVLPPGSTGEISVVASREGPWANRFRGLHSYLDSPRDTAWVHRGGRLHTGDIGWLDDDGYLFVLDRESDLINRGGSKVSPLEVETVLREHPAVTDCIVVPLADERLGHLVAAVVVLRAGTTVNESSLRSFCSASLAGYKVPSAIVTVTSLPRNPMGKVIRAEVHDMVKAAASDPKGMSR